VTVNGRPAAAGAPGRIMLPDVTGGGAVTVEAKVTATDAVTTQLLIGATDPFEVKLDGKVIGSGKGTGNRAAPDQEAFPVTLPKGDHTLTLVVKSKGAGQAVFARFLDPDRKLRYPDGGEKK
jgi:hypothetical protein